MIVPGLIACGFIELGAAIYFTESAGFNHTLPMAAGLICLIMFGAMIGSACTIMLMAVQR